MNAALLVSEVVATAMEATLGTCNESLEYTINNSLVNDVTCTATYAEQDYVDGSTAFTAHVVKVTLLSVPGISDGCFTMPTIKWTSTDNYEIQYECAETTSATKFMTALIPFMS